MALTVTKDMVALDSFIDAIICLAAWVHCVCTTCHIMVPCNEASILRAFSLTPFRVLQKTKVGFPEL